MVGGITMQQRTSGQGWINMAVSMLALLMAVGIAVLVSRGIAAAVSLYLSHRG
jgi:hypothetical protein